MKKRMLVALTLMLCGTLNMAKKEDVDTGMILDTGLPQKTLRSIANSLNNLLADEYILYVKTHNYHWNVTGKKFHDLHIMLEGQYKELSKLIDDIAERVRALGAPAFGSLAEFSEHTRLKETPGVKLKAMDMLKNLLADHESIIRSIREDMQNVVTNNHDYGTENFLGGLLEKHEKLAWMLRATLE